MTILAITWFIIHEWCNMMLTKKEEDSLQCICDVNITQCQCKMTLIRHQYDIE